MMPINYSMEMSVAKMCDSLDDHIKALSTYAVYLDSPPADRVDSVIEMANMIESRSKVLALATANLRSRLQREQKTAEKRRKEAVAAYDRWQAGS